MQNLQTSKKKFSTLRYESGVLIQNVICFLTLYVVAVAVVVRPVQFIIYLVKTSCLKNIEQFDKKHEILSIFLKFCKTRVFLP